MTEEGEWNGGRNCVPFESSETTGGMWWIADAEMLKERSWIEFVGKLRFCADGNWRCDGEIVGDFVLISGEIARNGVGWDEEEHWFNCFKCCLMELISS